MARFKHTSRLSYGAGLAMNTGLGKSWNNVRFTFEGIGLRTFAAYEFIYGIGGYAGYERMYKQNVFTAQQTEQVLQTKETPHNKKNYNEAIMIGLTKTYHLNDKWNGSMQVLYDIWWKEKGLKSPIQLRFTTMKK